MKRQANPTNSLERGNGPALAPGLTQARSQPLLEDIEDPDQLLNALVRMACETDYWHQRIKRALSEAGFIIRRLEREEAHPIWIAWLTRDSFELSANNRQASRQICRMLKKSALEIHGHEFNIIERRSDKFKCVFIFNSGVAGVIT